MAETQILLWDIRRIKVEGDLAERDKPRHRRPSIYIICHGTEHVIRRIISYEEAVTCFGKTALQWGSLFTKFSVELTNPVWDGRRDYIKGKSFEPGKLIDEVVDALDPELKSQTLDIDFRNFRSELKKQSGRPCFHGEIALWLHVQLQGQAFAQFTPFQTEGTINERRVVIGVSKPTCLMCSWYFQELSDKVLIRSTSGNAYLAWKAPFTVDDRQINVDMAELEAKLKNAARDAIQRGWAYRLDQDSAGGTPPAHRQTFAEAEYSNGSSEGSVSMDTSDSNSVVSGNTTLTGASGTKTPPRKNYLQTVTNGLQFTGKQQPAKAGSLQPKQSHRKRARR